MEAIYNALKLMRKDIQKETEIFLDSIDLDTPYNPPKFKMSFNGAEIEIPIDFAEINNTIDDFFKDLIEATRDYIGAARAFMKILPKTDTPEETFLNYLDTYTDNPDEIYIEDIQDTINEYLGEDVICGIWIEENENCTEYWVVCGDEITHQEE